MGTLALGEWKKSSKTNREVGVLEANPGKPSPGGRREALHHRPLRLPVTRQPPGPEPVGREGNRYRQRVRRFGFQRIRETGPHWGDRGVNKAPGCCI